MEQQESGSKSDGGQISLVPKLRLGTGLRKLRFLLCCVETTVRMSEQEAELPVVRSQAELGNECRSHYDPHRLAAIAKVAS